MRGLERTTTDHEDMLMAIGQVYSVLKEALVKGLNSSMACTLQILA